MDDMDCTPVENAFAGTFDGKGHLIWDCKSILPVRYLGLFGHVSGGTVKRTFIINEENYSLSATRLVKQQDGAEVYGNLIGGIAAKVSNGGTIDRCEERGGSIL